jgi:O-acetyl-ADP-ribose deacetylase (regulator of RNase III)
MITHRTGDLFASTDLDALAHGCNCRGVMGAGIAVVFARRWPQMEQAYRQRCRAGQFTLGQCMAWQAPDGPMVYNLATQDRPGRHARLDAVVTSAEAMIEHARAHGIRRIGLPRIGAGIGGLRWDQVEQALATLDSDGVELVVHTL